MVVVYGGGLDWTKRVGDQVIRLLIGGGRVCVMKGLHSDDCLSEFPVSCLSV